MGITHNYDAVVIGAGVAGTAVAISLARMGWSTLVLDKGTFPRHKVCGEFLSPESEDMLSALGVIGSIREVCPGEIERSSIVLASGRSLDVPLPGKALGVSRHTLDALLLKKAEQEGTQVRTGTAVASVTTCASGYEVRIVQNTVSEKLKARAVIVAWGRNPHIDKGMIQRVRTDTRGDFVGVKCHCEGLPRQHAVELYMFPGGYVGIAPIEGDRSNVAGLVNLAAFRRAGSSVEKLLQFAAAANQAFGRRLTSGSVVPGTVCAVAPVNTNRGLQPWGGMPHVGDAAVVIPPLCGDGMAIALRTAKWCADLTGDFLQGKMSADMWQTAYEAVLRRELAGPVRTGRLLQAALLRPKLAAALLRLGTAVPSLAGRAVRATRLSPG